MKMKLLVLWCVLVLGVAPTLASGVDCPALVKQALDTTTTLCEDTGRNQACYGNVMLQARPQPNVTDFKFDQPGSITNVVDIKSLRLSPMSPDKGEWGVALMRLQANLPATTGQVVTMLSFGDVLLENAAKTPTFLNVTVLGDDFINVRWRPNVNAGVLAVLNPGQTVTAIERLEDSSWLRIELPDSGETGWLHSSLVQTDGAVEVLNVSGAVEPSYRPMQAFYFESGSDEPACAEVPQNGLLIQTPEGTGEVRLWINEVKISMGSTVHFEAQRGGLMTVTALEGHATVEAMGITHTAVAGSSVQVKLNDQLQASEPPGQPQPYVMTDVENLPVSNLDRDIEIHPPLTEEEIAVVQNDQGDGSGQTISGDTCVPPCDAASASPGTGENSSAPNNCPGNSCNSNGNGNGNNQNCPGNSCNNNGNGHGNGNGNGDGHDNGDGDGHGNGNGRGNGDND